MPRLHTLYLPGNGEGMPFAFILDQTNPMDRAATTAWQSFAEKCGAEDIMFTAETIDIDPEISDGWQPDDDEPVDYAPSDRCCAPRLVGLPDLLSMVQAAHAAAWVPWEPANLDPESPRISTHREEVCPALNGSVLGCPIHEVFVGPWAAWPYYASRTAEEGGVVTRICPHGITHPTPEEYVGGFDTPHLCDGCPCAAPDDRDRYAIVVSDLANTRLPRGTLLLGVKDDPAPSATDLIAADWKRRGAAPDARGWDALYGGPPGAQDDPTPVTAPPAPDFRDNLAAFGAKVTADLTAENWFAPVPITHEGAPVGTAELHPDGRVRGTFAPVVTHEADTVTTEMLAKAPLSGDWARIQPLGTDGEPVGEAKDYLLAGPVAVTKVEEELSPIERWATGEVELTTFDRVTGRDSVVDAGWVAPPETCLAGSEASRCTRPYGHEGLHEFGPFTRI